jgi:2-phosphosulfolactate phosphatase
MSDRDGVYGQDGHRVKLRWGRRGATAGAEAGEILVIVDTLSFSTAVTIALENGAVVWPAATEAEAAARAAEVGAEVAVSRRDVPQRGRFSLSPSTWTGVEPGTRVVLPSPNGSTLARLGESAPVVLLGCLRNSWACAVAARKLGFELGVPISVLAAGERWPDDQGLRFSVEDLIGAGAIITAIDLAASPEARAARAAFEAARGDLAAVLSDSGSGRELIAGGFADDVRHAARLDVTTVIPRLTDGRFEALR